jgi:hypothetical protein
MFKKVLQSLTRSLGGNKPKTPPAPSARVLERIAGQAAPAERGAPQSAEELCGIARGMGKSQIADRLKLLYRRHNRAASSLDARTRAEAEHMLDAIVEIREKTFGPI